MQDFSKIPLEMRGFNQWVGWRYENRGTEKPTKVPYCLTTRRFASINNPNDWTDFDTAIQRSNEFDGLGFVLTLTDPFCFVDLDRSNDPEIIQKQISLHNELDTYSEVSPGGGLHVICKASIASGRRRDAIELYSSSRFMTMTGNVYNEKPITFRQALISNLWDSLEGVSANLSLSTHTEVSEFTDREIYDQAASAVNGLKFLDLWEGRGDLHYTKTDGSIDASRADFALINILAFYTQDRSQIKRLFRGSTLGQRAKANREDYVESMITKSFDQLIPKVDISGLMHQINNFVAENQKVDFAPAFVAREPMGGVQQLQPREVLIKEKEKRKSDKDPDKVFEMPPGIVGQIADFIYKQAWKPVPQIATLGALGLMAGICGRSYNANGSGLNLYLLLLAKTGRGKEAISKGYEKIFDAVQPIMPTIGDFFGPGDLASGQALLRYMSDHETKSFVSVFGEFGPMLKRITSPMAIGADLMTQKVMLDMYGKSGKSGKISPTAYSDAERNTKTIHSPGFSFVAESAPKWFDDNVDIGMISTGLLPRFIIAEYDGIRVTSNHAGPLLYPSQDLIQNICAVATCSLTCFQQNVVVNIAFDDDASKMSSTLDVYCDGRINDAKDEIVAELWNRVHLNTIRVAGLLAVGMNPYSPVIDAECWQWAERFISYNIQKLEEKFNDGICVSVDSETEFSELEKLEKTIVQFIMSDFPAIKSYAVPENLHRCRVIPYSFFQRRLCRIRPFSHSKIGAGNALKRAIQNLIDNGDLQEISKAEAVRDLNFHGRCFAVRSMRLLEKAKAKVSIDD